MKNQKPSWFERLKPFIAVIFLQTGFAGMDVLSKAALNMGMSNYVLVVYSHVVAFLVIAPFAVILDKKARPKMTFSIFMKIVALSLLEYRLNEEKAEWIIYVTEVGQQQHLDMVFKVVKRASWLPADDALYPKATHVSFGLVLGEDGKRF